MPTRKKDPPRETYINNNLPILYVDSLDVSHRTDGMNYLSFKTNNPDGSVEQARLMIEDKSLHQIIEDLCQVTDYVPEITNKTKRAPSK